MYYLRARYMRPDTGRFWSRDTYEGSAFDPSSLHKYSYVSGNPVNGIDPTGKFGISIAENMMSMAIATTIAAMSTIALVQTRDKIRDALSDLPFAIPDPLDKPTREPSPGPPPDPAPQPEPVPLPNPQPEDDDDDLILVRQGADWESATRLSKKAAEAESAGVARNGVPYGHGVSVTNVFSHIMLSRDPADASFATKKAFEAAGFEVRYTPTRRDPNHRTVQLPKPVTTDVAARFNMILGRSKR